MSSPDLETPTPELPPRRSATALVAIIIAAAVFAALAGSLLSALDIRVAYKAWLVALAAAAAFAGAAALGWWTPRWNENRNATVVWLLPRLVLIAFAISAIATSAVAAASAYRAPLPTCPETFSSSDPELRGGELLSARMRGNTFVCTYRDLSGSL